MKYVLVGVSCVGKTTTGRILAQLLDYDFVDFDMAMKERHNKTLTQLHNAFFTNYEYRQFAAPLLADLLKAYPDRLVISMPPSGMYREYKKLYDADPKVVTIWLKDSAENILKRVVFTDENDEIDESYTITPDNRDHYYNEIKGDIAFYYSTLRKADINFKVSGRSAQEASAALAKELVARYPDGMES